MENKILDEIERVTEDEIARKLNEAIHLFRKNLRSASEHDDNLVKGLMIAIMAIEARAEERVKNAD